MDKDISIRSSNFTWFKFLSGLFVTIVIFGRAFFCDTMVAGLGGHLVLTSLWLFNLLLVFVVQCQPSQRKKQRISRDGDLFHSS